MAPAKPAKKKAATPKAVSNLYYYREVNYEDLFGPFDSLALAEAAIREEVSDGNLVNGAAVEIFQRVRKYSINTNIELKEI